MVRMHTSFRVSICCLSSADHSMCYTLSRHTPYRNPLPNKATLLVAGETQGCVRIMLWEWVNSIEQPVTAQYEVCLLPPLSVAYANRLSWRGACVCLVVLVCGKVKELILRVSQGRRGPFSHPSLLRAHPTTTTHCMPLLKTRTLCFLFVSKSPLTPPPVHTQTH